MMEPDILLEEQAIELSVMITNILRETDNPTLIKERIESDPNWRKVLTAMKDPTYASTTKTIVFDGIPYNLKEIQIEQLHKLMNEFQRRNHK